MSNPMIAIICHGSDTKRFMSSAWLSDSWIALSGTETMFLPWYWPQVHQDQHHTRIYHQSHPPQREQTQGIRVPGRTVSVWVFVFEFVIVEEFIIVEFIYHFGPSSRIDCSLYFEGRRKTDPKRLGNRQRGHRNMDFATNRVSSSKKGSIQRSRNEEFKEG